MTSPLLANLITTTTASKSFEKVQIAELEMGRGQDYWPGIVTGWVGIGFVGFVEVLSWTWQGLVLSWYWHV